MGFQEAMIFVQSIRIEWSGAGRGLEMLAAYSVSSRHSKTSCREGEEEEAGCVLYSAFHVLSIHIHEHYCNVATMY